MFEFVRFKLIRAVCIGALLFTTAVYAEDETTDEAQAAETTRKLSNFMIETHPIALAMWGPNFDVEVNFNSPVSIFTEYQHYMKSGLLQKEYRDKDYQEELEGNNFIIGLRYYPRFATEGLDGLYFGIALDYIDLDFETTNEYTVDDEYVFNRDKVAITAYGPRVNMGWRWIYPSGLTLRFGFFGGYYILSETDFEGYIDCDHNDAKIHMDVDEEFAYFLTGTFEKIRAGFEFSVGFAF